LNERKIFIIGSLGSGKYTVGLTLAERLGFPSHDTFLCYMHAKTIANRTEEITERGIIDEICDAPGPAVISTTATIELDDELWKRGILLFLDSSSLEEAARLSDVETAYYGEKADITVPLNDSRETDDLVVDLLCDFVEREKKSRVKHVGIE
jgi:adenylate kinase family enzyme